MDVTAALVWTAKAALGSLWAIKTWLVYIGLFSAVGGAVAVAWSRLNGWISGLSWTGINYSGTEFSDYLQYFFGVDILKEWLLGAIDNLVAIGGSIIAAIGAFFTWLIVLNAINFAMRRVRTAGGLW